MTTVAEPSPHLASLWTRALDGLDDGMVQPQHRAFLRLTRPIAVVEGTAVLAAPNEFAKEVIETRIRGLLTDALSRQAGEDIRIAVTVDPQATAAGAAAKS